MQDLNPDQKCMKGFAYQCTNLLCFSSFLLLLSFWYFIEFFLFFTAIFLIIFFLSFYLSFFLSFCLSVLFTFFLSFFGHKSIITSSRMTGPIFLRKLNRKNSTLFFFLSLSLSLSLSFSLSHLNL